MGRLDSLFAEDVQMQDALEDLGNITDNSEDIVLSVIEDRANSKEANELHLFSDEPEVNEDGLTADEEREVQMALLNADDEDLDLDDDDDLDLDED